MLDSKPIIKADYLLPDGDAGIYTTVDYMWNYAIRDSTEGLIQRKVKELQGKSKYETIKNIFNYVINNVEYEYDPPDREQITAPIHYLNGNRHTGDCDCMTTLLVCLLIASGLEAAITVIAWRNNDYTHVFAEVQHNNRWFILDATLGINGFGRQDKEIIRYRRITEQEMTKLTVLADAAPVRRIMKGCCGGNKDNNRNTNNIHINFGTTVDNSNPLSTDNGTPIRARPVPSVPNFSNNPSNIKPEQSNQKLLNVESSNNQVPLNIQSSELINQLLSNHSPRSMLLSSTPRPRNYVPSTKPHTKPSFIEFP
jgi:hypothetical protein